MKLGRFAIICTSKGYFVKLRHIFCNIAIPAVSYCNIGKINL